MATLVHLAPEKECKKIVKSGIKAVSWGWYELRGVYCMPVLPNFYISHQWMRELKRSGQRTFVGVQFKVPDEEVVYIGHYNNEPTLVKAAEAAQIIQGQEDAQGYQVFIPRNIKPREITRIKILPQKIGWRYYPEAKGNKPCGCPVCIPRGEIRGRKIREKWEAENG